MADPIRLMVVSTSRSDLGILSPVIERARQDARFTVGVLICGMHIAEQTPDETVMKALGAIRLPRPDCSLGLVHQVAMRDLLVKQRIEVVVLLGDRAELLEVGLACIHAGVAIAHCSGGERTLGAWDDQVRDAMTKLAHVHFPAHQTAGQRLRALGEEDWRICVAGEPALDAICAQAPLSAAAIAPLVGAVATADDLVIALHPVTRRAEETDQLCALISAHAAEASGQVFLSSPNGDPGSDSIRACWQMLKGRHAHVHLLDNHGAPVFRAVVSACGLLIGNSSAGLVEAPALGASSIDLGSRQSGRLRGGSVVTCSTLTLTALRQAIVVARSHDCRSHALPAENPYGDGRSVPRILDTLARLARRDDLLVKA